MTPETLLLVLERDDWRCVRCGMPIHGERGMDWSIQHRKPRGMGGSKDPQVRGLANLIVLCGSGTTGCHGFVESHRAEALICGWLVSRYANPADCAVLVDHGSRWVCLTGDGQYAEGPAVIEV